MAARVERRLLDDLVAQLHEARQRTLDIIQGLSPDQLMGPRLAIVNPLRWEVGHVGWFQERWLLRHLSGQPPILTAGDALYDSSTVPHDTRWDLPLPSVQDTVGYIQRILDSVVEEHSEHRLAERPAIDGCDAAYFLNLALYHESMHAEAFTYTRQTLGYPAPAVGTSLPEPFAGAALEGGPPLEDCPIPGGTLWLGSPPGSPFVFDNEQWAHPFEVAPFSMARAAVSQREFAGFVDDGGYQRRDLWSEAGWDWRSVVGAEHPVYWQPAESGGWLRRQFDAWVPLETDLPVLHVSWYEADAYSRWAGRRLPTEAEWELAASGDPPSDAKSVTGRKRRYPWGNEPPTPERANLDWRAAGCIDVRALPAGDSAFGCRQMIGNTWEWTSTVFGPYPGFSAGPYRDYSKPWFGDHMVLRGGCWATRSSLITNTYRNFYKPDRRDVWAGFRTCAL